MLNVYENNDTIIVFSLKKCRKTRGHEAMLVMAQRRLYTHSHTEKYSFSPKGLILTKKRLILTKDNTKKVIV